MSIEGTNIQIEGFDELQKKLTIVLPKIVRDMAFTADASLAVLARREEQQGASRLEMGKPQKKGRKGFRTYSAWSSATGWVSTSKMTKNGPLSMGHFSWARGTRTRKDSVIAEYGSRLANLWARPTKPYSRTSPTVGQQGKLTRWRMGQIRPSLYNWSMTAVIANSMAEQAVARTEKRFVKQFKEL